MALERPSTSSTKVATAPSLGARIREWGTPSSWVIVNEPSTFAPSSKWSNRDMDPVPEAYRTWTRFSWCTYWITDAYNCGTYDLASTMLAVGLSWQQSLAAIIVGHLFLSWTITLNGTIGARLNVPFPVINRSSFGFYGASFSIVSRGILAMFWFAVQTYIGSECMYQMLKALFPSIADIPNRLSSDISSRQLLCYFLFWLVQLPFLFISPQSLRWLFLAKAIIVPPALFAMLGWAFATTGGGAIFQQQGSLSGSQLAWTWLGALNSTLGTITTLAVNIPDFTRYARSKQDQYIQLIVVPIVFTLVGFIGIACTSAGYVHYGQYYWDPLDLIDHWDNRPAAFFASAALALATICTNISANSFSAANDLTALFPRYMNITRGQVFCAFIGGWVLCPWEILAQAVGFLNFMAGYTIVLGPICGIMIADFWIVHRTHIDVPSLYRPMGRYRYWKGFNWRVGVALALVIPPNLPGLVNAINPKIEVGDAMYPYRISWLTGFFGAAIIYTACSLIWPATETMIKESILDDDNEIALGVKRGDNMDHLQRNRAHSPIARTISVNDDRSEKGKPSWSVQPQA